MVKRVFEWQNRREKSYLDADLPPRDGPQVRCLTAPATSMACAVGSTYRRKTLKKGFGPGGPGDHPCPKLGNPREPGISPIPGHLPVGATRPFGPPAAPASPWFALTPAQ